MSKILRTHPKSVQAHKDLILQCLDDKDESIRLRALDLLYGMVSVHTMHHSVCMSHKDLILQVLMTRTSLSDSELLTCCTAWSVSTPCTTLSVCVSHKDLILECLDDKDESIRLRALDLLYGMVSVHTCSVRLSVISIFLLNV